MPKPLEGDKGSPVLAREAVWTNADTEGEGAQGAFVGIDLGTSNSCLGLWHAGKNRVKIIKNRKDEGRTTPSLVYYHGEGPDDYSVGNEALKQSESGINPAIRAVKRIMGLSATDPKALEVAGSLPYTLTTSPMGDTLLEIGLGNKTIKKRPQDVSSLVLKELRLSAEAYLSRKPFPGVPGHVDRAVIGVPAHFNEAQKKATREAARLAGFLHVETMSEPVAAAMAYGLFVAGNKSAVIFDFGGGTCDVSVLEISEGTIEVLATAGDNHLGGEDIDTLLLAHVLKELSLSSTSLSAHDLSVLRAACCQAKVSLSSVKEATIDLQQVLPHLAQRTTRQNKGSVLITRQQLQEMIQPLLQRTKRIVEAALEGGDVKAREVDEVVLVGGCSRIPAVRAMLQDVFGKDRELCTSINPDEAVAEGCAIRAAILSGVDHRVLRDLLMIDVVPLSIGLETASGEFEVLLAKNTRIPATVTKYFELDQPDQKFVNIKVFEGESAVASDNYQLASLVFPVGGQAIAVDKEEPPGDEDDGRQIQGEEHEDAVSYLVPVTFHMDLSGCLRISVGADEDQAPADPQSLYWLVLYCALLFGVYVFLKVYFRQERWMTEQASKGMVEQVVEEVVGAITDQQSGQPQGSEL